MTVTQKNKQQRGMATFAVTTALILVISLIVIGFSLTTRRSQQQTLDRQLGQQASAAAEAGVNMAAAILQKKLVESNGNPASIPEKTACAPDANYPKVEFTSIDTNVTCLLVKNSTPTLQYANVTENAPTVIPLKASSVPTTAELSWTNSDGSTATGCAYPDNTHSRPVNWNCGFGLLRIDVAPLSNGNVGAVAYTAFLYPFNQPTVPSAPITSLNGGWVDAACSNGRCRVNLTGLSTAGTQYFVSVRSLYKKSNISISGTNVSGSSVQFTSQAVIDSTARAGDVIKRIQVRVPLQGGASATAPGYAIESEGSLCKRYSVAPGYYNGYGLSCRTE